MPEINPLTNDQIFLKKIAENTGSNYETGDVSEINPLSIDQIFLKEIAANTARQAGDIAELESKVTANSSAIEAIENVLGAKNVFHGWLVESSTRLNTTFDITPATSYIFTYDEPVKQLQYRLYFTDSSGTDTEITSGWTNLSSPLSLTTFNDTSHVGLRIRYVDDSAILPTDITSSMIRPAGTDATYTPYAMTNRELTEEVEELNSNLSPMVNPISDWQLIKNDTYNVSLSYKRSGNVVTGYVMTNNLSTALDYNQWTTLFSDLPFNLDGIQITQITGNVKICSFLISNSIQIIVRSSVGMSAGDVFSFNFVGISTV